MNHFVINHVVTKEENFHFIGKIQLTYTLYKDHCAQYIFDILIIDNVEYIAHPSLSDNTMEIIPYFSRTVIFAFRFCMEQQTKNLLKSADYRAVKSNNIYAFK
ncbi:hypothetical protein LJC68_07605 [Bacteroidales bacterium OttesenSCG-928-B11]|nr:hypothetical protein [Bacteroidales bacterium OttesenSCG-928-C03]MDL2312724.1 hypothetical protein [Bacteroidales bacterium OttesenSCG-928-B11]MDL2326420.1 hypothetical protein [Bacteroidales bacterium OttesenSCG-928-A14]